MSKRRVFVGNFPFNKTEQDLRDLFAPRSIVEVRIVQDRETGRSRGFGFVEFASDEEAVDALSLNDSDWDGRPLHVDFATERPQRDGDRRSSKGGQGRGRGRDNHGWNR